jgi:uncharacterized membrane protein YkvA (DUF1232 family)
MLRLRKLLKIAGRDLALLWYACRNPATPKSVKLGALALALYLVSPIDLIPDWIPLAGWLDDVTIATLAIPFLLRMVPLAQREQAEQQGDGFLRRFAFWRT